MACVPATEIPFAAQKHQGARPDSLRFLRPIIVTAAAAVIVVDMSLLPGTQELKAQTKQTCRLCGREPPPPASYPYSCNGITAFGKPSGCAAGFSAGTGFSGF
ncbi:hypothetical protein LZ31DRAFT_558415 [Colletotrichum somersetense]|nr:hypothetical protein LZ31DRAFT_558415 [Colletotrichum somersetense]